MASKTDDRSIEYQALRQELREIVDRDFKLINLGVTVTAVILGAAFTQGNSLVFLVALVPLSMALFQVSRNALAYLRVVSYIRTFLEPDSGFRWETKLDNLREQFQIYRPYNKHTLFGATSYETGAILLGVAAIILAALYVSHWYDYAACGAAAIGWWLFFTVIHARLEYVQSGQYEEDLRTLW